MTFTSDIDAVLAETADLKGAITNLITSMTALADSTQVTALEVSRKTANNHTVVVQVRVTAVGVSDVLADKMDQIKKALV